jgi:dihydrofolate synthase / folylpolyglutamate synthase
MIINNFKQAEAYLSLHIPANSQQKFPGELGLKRAKYFLHLLDNPQEKLKIVHVAGTSGKGSTCYLVSSLLFAHGFKVGLHQSPHLTDVRERFQINGKIISEKEFIFYLNKTIPIIDIVKNSSYGPPTYFEILVGLAYYIFYEKKVDYVVMETGMGGWHDATNVVERPDKIAVLTKIGLDHTNILGKTIKEIAFQKAMIINENGQAISIDQEQPVKKVFKEVVKEKKAKLHFVRPLSFNFSLNLIGGYQRENAGLALKTINFLSKRDGFLINRKQIIKVFNKAHFPGRFDIKKINGKTIVFDGAHNPQKMLAFINALIKKYPDKKFNFLLAFKKGKDYQGILKTIIPWANSIVLTGFFTDNQDLINLSEKPTTIGKQLKELGFNNFMVISSNKKAWEIILHKKGPIVVTGSLYLIGEVFKLIKEK